MTRKRPRAAIYARISDARDGDTAGVDRQTEDCVALCESNDYELVDTFVDNNRSAYKPGGKRPAYDRMMTAVDDQQVDVIVVYSADRLYRRLTDLEQLADRLRAHRVFVKTVVSGDVDLSHADGLFQAGMLAVVAKHESQKRGERISRAALQRAEQGKFGGGTRRFGYNKTCTELVPEEADALRYAYEQVAAGASIRSVWREWQRRGLVGPNGGRITTGQITQMLRRPMNAGLASYKNEVLAGKSQAPALIDVETWQKVQAILSDPSRKWERGKGRPAKALMAGLMRCGVCGEKVYRHYRGKSRANPEAYACTQGRCTTRSGDVVDMFVVGLLGEWLAANAKWITKPPPKAKRNSADDPVVMADELRRRLDDLALLMAAGQLGVPDYAKAVKEVRSRLDAVESRIAEEAGLSATRELVKNDNVNSAWRALDIEGKRAVIAEVLAAGLIESITLEKINPGGAGYPGVTVVWGKS